VAIGVILYVSRSRLEVDADEPLGQGARPPPPYPSVRG